MARNVPHEIFCPEIFLSWNFFLLKVFFSSDWFLFVQVGGMIEVCSMISNYVVELAAARVLNRTSFRLENPQHFICVSSPLFFWSNHGCKMHLEQSALIITTSREYYINSFRVWGKGGREGGGWGRGGWT